MPCPFCLIAGGALPSSDPPILISPLGSAYYVLSTPIVVAFLDIAPVSTGHILLCPREHREKAIEMTPNESAAIGFWLPVLSRAVMRALLGGTDGSWNIIQANGTAAGQTVPHSHFHIIPRIAGTEDGVEITDAERRNLVLGEGPRVKLTSEDGKRLSELIKAEVAKEIESLQEQGVLSSGDASGELWAAMPHVGLKL